MVSAEAVIAIKYTTNTLTLCCAILRFFILRRYERGIRTFRSTLCHIFLFTACGMDFSATSGAAYVLLNEIKYIKQGDSYDVVQEKLLLPVNLRVFYWAHLMYYLSLCTIRGAYIVFYSGLYSGLVTKRRYALYAAGVITAGVYICAILILFLWCQPFVDNWNPNAQNDHCPSIFDPPAFAALSSMNIVADLAILIVPILIISAFSLGGREKASLFLVFCIGGTSIIASAARLGVILHLLEDEQFNWRTIHIFSLWSHAEVFFGVLAFTLPSFRYVLYTALRKIGRSAAHESIKLDDQYPGSQPTTKAGFSSIATEHDPSQADTVSHTGSQEDMIARRSKENLGRGGRFP